MPFGSFARNSSSPELWEGRNGAGLLATGEVAPARRRQKRYGRRIGNPRTSIVSIRDALRLALQDYLCGDRGEEVDIEAIKAAGRERLSQSSGLS